MNQKLTSFVSVLALGTLFATPVFAQSPTVSVSDRTLIQSCREIEGKTYRASMQSAMTDMDQLIIRQWSAQSDARMHDAAPNRLVISERSLTKGKTQLNTGLDAFTALRMKNIDGDTAGAADVFIRLDGDAEERALQRWSDKSLSMQSLNVVLNRAEATLRANAKLKDRAAISRAWKDTRKQAFDAFAKARLDARDAFVQDMESCIAGDSVSADETEADETTDVDSFPASTFAATSATVSVSPERQTTCKQTFAFTGEIGTNAAGLVKYHWEFSDGVSTPDETIAFASAGRQTVRGQRDISSAFSGWATLVVTVPNSVVSPKAFFTLTCQPSSTTSTQQIMPLIPVTDQSKADARLVVDGKSDVTECTPHRYTFTGTVSYGLPGIVKYHWLRSDGSIMDDMSLVFAAAGTQTVTNQWDLDATTDGWMRLIISSPNNTQAQADVHFVHSCPVVTTPIVPAPLVTLPTGILPLVAARVTSVAIVDNVDYSTTPKPQNITTCGEHTFTWLGRIRTNSVAPLTTTSQWERSDGLIDPLGHYVEVPSASVDGYVVYNWTVSGNVSGWVRLHTSSPNDISSDQAYFTLTQSCRK